MPSCSIYFLSCRGHEVLTRRSISRCLQGFKIMNRVTLNASLHHSPTEGFTWYAPFLRLLHKCDDIQTLNLKLSKETLSPCLVRMSKLTVTSKSLISLLSDHLIDIIQKCLKRAELREIILSSTRLLLRQNSNSVRSVERRYMT